MRAGQRTTATAKQIAAAELAQRETQDRKEQVRDLWHRLQMVVDDRAALLRPRRITGQRNLRPTRSPSYPPS
jgi:hypothetical protein